MLADCDTGLGPCMSSSYGFHRHHIHGYGSNSNLQTSSLGLGGGIVVAAFVVNTVVVVDAAAFVVHTVVVDGGDTVKKLEGMFAQDVATDADTV